MLGSRKANRREDCEEIVDDLQMAPLSYVRDRSMLHSFMIVDEAQNLTPLEVRTLISRSGEESKMVFTGDVDQIDNPLGERSELATKGAKLL